MMSVVCLVIFGSSLSSVAKCLCPCLCLCLSYCCCCRLSLAEVETAACTHALILGGMCVGCLAPIKQRLVQRETVQAGFVSSERDLRLDKEVSLL